MKVFFLMLVTLFFYSHKNDGVVLWLFFCLGKSEVELNSDLILIYGWYGLTGLEV